MPAATLFCLPSRTYRFHCSITHCHFHFNHFHIIYSLFFRPTFNKEIKSIIPVAHQSLPVVTIISRRHKPKFPISLKPKIPIWFLNVCKVIVGKCVSLWCLALQQRYSSGLTFPVTAVSQWVKESNRAMPNIKGKIARGRERNGNGGQREGRKTGSRQDVRKGKTCNEF